MIRHISLGTNEVFYYNYFGEQLPLRPITTIELDDCFYKALRFADEEIADLVVKLKLRLIKPKTPIKIDNNRYAELQKYYNSLDYWIVYFAMKDFQDEDFAKPIDGIPNGLHLVRKMRDIHKIAKSVLNASYQPREVIRELVMSDDGKVVASIVFNLNIPLTDYANMTKLQRDFLVLSKLGGGKPVKISKSGEKMQIRKKLKEVV
jgi:hypothetical protein